jgi:hypothetical protein
MTEFERIKSMTTEEMAKLLCELVNVYPQGIATEDTMTEWLESEVE